ncbi:hypothetical protein LCGC14_3110380, partial [marine sediment metagenome]
FILSCARKDGLISYQAPRPPHMNFEASHTAIYNHPIAGLCLAELYGMGDSKLAPRIKAIIPKALTWSAHHQHAPKKQAHDRGGWRYLYPCKGSPHVQSDLSVTSWQLLFMRSAKNAGFKVPAKDVEEAMAYVMRCFDRGQGTFLYSVGPPRTVKRAMAGAGILSLSLGGRHDTAMARSAGDWLLRHPFKRYNGGVGLRYHYSIFYGCQGMFQLGGRYWRQYFRPTAMTLVTHQRADGSFQPENHKEGYFGNAYTTALATLGLTAPNQMLPIFQR